MNQDDYIAEAQASMNDPVNRYSFYDKHDEYPEQAIYGGPDPSEEMEWWFDTSNFDGDPVDLF